MDNKLKDAPLSESSISLKLAEIQERCSKLMDEPDALLELSLEEPAPKLTASNDPCNYRS